jgi:AcrR family transcriptional regulator
MRPRRARGSLSDHAILDAAYRLIEHNGFDALSMPALAKALHSGVTSIYWHFRSKADLLEALVDRAAGEVCASLPEPGGGSWEHEAERYYIAYREQLRCRPVYLELLTHDPGMVASRSDVAAARHGRDETELAIFTGRGVDRGRADRLRSACLTYLRGYVIVEHGMRVESRDGDPGDGGEMRVAFTRLDPATYPVLHDLADPGLFLPADDQQFVIGLRLLLRGAMSTFGADTDGPTT